MEKVMKAVILCGGMATRMLPITKSIPKEMMPVLNRPILDFLIDDLVACGVTDVLIITNRGKECIENFYDLHPELNYRLKETGKLELLKDIEQISSKANVHFIRQITPLGTGHALKRAESFVGNQPFLFVFGDELMYNPQKSLIKQLVDVYNKTNCSVISATTCPISESYKYGMLELQEGKLKQIVEKPQPKDSPSDVCFLGNSVLTPQIFEHIVMQESGETGVVDALNSLASVADVNVCMIEGERFDVGNKLGLVKANVFYGLQDAEIKEELKQYLADLLDKF